MGYGGGVLLELGVCALWVGVGHDCGGRGDDTKERKGSVGQYERVRVNNCIAYLLCIFLPKKPPICVSSQTPNIHSKTPDPIELIVHILVTFFVCYCRPFIVKPLDFELTGLPDVVDTALGTLVDNFGLPPFPFQFPFPFPPFPLHPIAK